MLNLHLFMVTRAQTAQTLVVQRSVTRNKQIGLSIVELMIAMLIGVFLLVGMIEMVDYSKQSFTSAVNLSRQQETGRMATHLIASDLKRAGYLGGNTDNSNIGGSSPPTPPDLKCQKSNTTWGRMITLPIVGLNNTSAGYNCIETNPATVGSYLQGDVLTLRYAETATVSPADIKPQQLYLRNDLLKGALFVGQEVADPLNNITDPLSSVRRMVALNYFVGNSGRTCNDDPVPSLFRTRLDVSGQPTAAEEVLPGVEHFQVQYQVQNRDLMTNTVIDTRYRNADELTLDEWKNVVAAKIWLLVRTECSENQLTDNPAFTMGDVVGYQPTPPHPNRNFRRQLYSRVVKLNTQT